jgi:hypothetical protein
LIGRTFLRFAICLRQERTRTSLLFRLSSSYF